MTARSLACWLAFAVAAFAQDLAPLPEWQEADLAALKKNARSTKGDKGSKSDKKAEKDAAVEPAALIPGVALLTDERPPEEAGEPKPEPMAYEAPAPGEISDQPVPQVSEEFWSAYFAERPASFLLDPQKLLSPAVAEQRLNFLKYHAGDSSIDLFVYVFDGPQEIPGEVRAEELVERFFSAGRPAAVVLYFLGSPDRSELMLSPAITDAISPLEQRRTLQSSVTSAMEKSHPAEQLEAFTLQLSIRLYWMERVMNGGPEATPAVAATPVEPRTEKDERKERLLAMARPWALPAGAGAGGLLLLFLLRLWWKARAKFRFPEFDVEPRLGGDHAAGVGAVISFSSPALPPGRQREMPDYLRRM